MIFSKSRLFATIIALFGLLTLTACSGADILNATIPHSGYTIHKDIAYGENARQRLDIYTPDDARKHASVIVFFYGGSWQSGNKDAYRFVGQAFASKGYVTVIADYRLYPEIYFPEFMNDAARAFVWTHDHIKQYGGDPQNIFLAGHSAGGYIAAMLTVNDRYIKAASGQRTWIKGTIGIAGPYDFLPFTDPKIKAIFSRAQDADTQPINFVTSGLPPMLLLHGKADTEVLPRNSINMAAKLRHYHDPVTERFYPGVAHVGIVLSLANGFRGKAPALQDISEFVDSNSN